MLLVSFTTRLLNLAFNLVQDIMEIASMTCYQHPLMTRLRR